MLVKHHKLRDILNIIPISNWCTIALLASHPNKSQLVTGLLLRPVRVSTSEEVFANEKMPNQPLSLSAVISSHCVVTDSGLKSTKITASKHNKPLCFIADSVIGGWRSMSAYFTLLRQKLAEIFLQLLPQPHAGMVIAAVLGDKGWLSDEVRPRFETTGTQHLLATSGLHLSLMISLAKNFISFLQGRRQASLLWLLASCYVLMVGLRISLLRAFGMLSLSLIARYGVYRQYDALHALAVVAVITMIVDLETITSISFLLSFGATWSIILYADLLGRFLAIPQASQVYADLSTAEDDATSSASHHSSQFIKRFMTELGQLYRYIKSLIVVGIAAQLVTAPLVLIFFGETPLLAFVPSAILSLIMPLLLGGEVVIGSAYLLLERWLVSSSLELFAIRLLAWLPAEVFARLLGILGHRGWGSVQIQLNYLMLLVWIYGLWLLYKLLNHQRKKCQCRSPALRSNLSCFA